jgi:glutaredoxin-like protein NrdH
MDYLIHVEGRQQARIVLFALSTCVWCRRTRQFLEGLGLAYDYVYVDQLGGEAARQAEADLARWSSRGAYPTLVIDERVAITGFNETKIREALGV